MSEGGTNQPSPLAYNGTIFLNNTGGIVQALDGKTGDLIWEQRLGVEHRDARHGALRRQAVSRAERRASGGARRAHRRGGLGRRDARRRAAAPAVRSSRNGKVIQGMGGCTPYVEQKCFISAYDAATGKQLWRFNTVAQDGEPGGDTWGSADRPVPRGRRDLDHRQLRSRSEPHVLGHGAGQAVDAGQPRHARRSTRRSTRARRVALDADTGKLAWYFQHAPGEALDLDDRLRARARGHRRPEAACSPSARTASCGSSIARPASILGHKETVFQNVWESFDPEDRRAALPRGHHRRTRSASGSMDARAPRAATTGRR